MILDNNLVIAGSISALGVITGLALNGAGAQAGASPLTIDIASLALGNNQAGDFGQGEDLRIAISVLTAPTVGTNVRYQLCQSDDANLSVGVQVLSQTDDFTIAQLPAGTLVPLFWDRAAPFAPKRYIGLRAFNTGAIATHSIFAAIVKDIQDIRNIYYRSGYAVA